MTQPASGDRRFMETTRGQIVALLRRGQRTVDEVARTLDLTDNAVRAHLATLERDGLIRQGGVRRSAGAGKPASLYELHPDAEPLFSRAYAPFLSALLEELASRLSRDEIETLLEGMGRRLAAASLPPPTATFKLRLRAAVELLNSLGGAADLEERDGVHVIRGCGCPISAAVARRPEVCRAVEALLSDVVGVRVRQCCAQGERPSCCFEVPSAA
ncbi:MAG: helix-turn-helix transcriptional regulator [Gemmatimonadales bacterium]